MKNNGFNKIEIRQRIMEATSSLNNHYFIKIAKRMSASNADLLARFIILNRRDGIVSNNTIELYIDGIVYLENYNNHKDLNKIGKEDIISFLYSYRKSEAIDPLHKWINTYNMRLDTIYKFFKWLYNLKNGSSADGLAPPVMNGIKRLKRKERARIKQKIYGLMKMM